MPFEHGVGLVAPVSAEESMEQVDDCPEVSALLDVYLKEVAEVIEARCCAAEVALLFDRGRLRIALYDQQPS